MKLPSLLKYTLVVLSASVVVACDNASSIVASPLSSNKPEISGKAVKGLISNGQVTLFGVVNSQEVQLAQSKTDNSGNYELDVPGDYSGPVRLVVTAIEGTTMICDAPAGCNDVPFGGSVNLDVGTSMSAVMRNVLPNQPVNIHVTPITTMAAAHVDANGGLNAENIAFANEKVASVFKLPGDFVSIEPVNVADSTSLASAKSSEINYGVLAGAFAGGSADELSQRIDSYANAFANDQLFEDSSDSSAATIKAIFQPAADLAQHIEQGAIKAQFDSLVASLKSEEVSDTDTSGNANSELDTMVQAALDDVTRLSTTLNQQTLQNYVDSQVDQFSWILKPELLQTAFSSALVVREVFYVALAHDYLVTVADEDGNVDRSSVAGGTNVVNVTYNVNTKLLSFKTNEGEQLRGHTIDFDIEIHPISDGQLLGEMPYILKEGGSISNQYFNATFNKDSSIRFIFDELDDFSDVKTLLNMLDALFILTLSEDPNDLSLARKKLISSAQKLPEKCASQTSSSNGDEAILLLIDCVVGDFLTGLKASGYLDFGMLVTNVSDTSQQFDIDFKGYADLDFTDPSATKVARLEIQNGHLFTPNGDRLFTVDGAKGLVLDLGNTDNTMFAKFGIDSVLIPETHVSLRADFHDLQDYLDLFNQTPMNFDFDKLQLANVFQKPGTTFANFVQAALEEGAILDTLKHLVSKTTPKDYIKTLAMGLEVQPGAEWPTRRYDVEFINNRLHLTNQDGISFVFMTEEGAIVSNIRGFGNDLVVIKVTESGVNVTDIDDKISIDMDNLPVNELMSVYSRLGILIDLDEDLKDLLDRYVGTGPAIDLGNFMDGK